MERRKAPPIPHARSDKGIRVRIPWLRTQYALKRDSSSARKLKPDTAVPGDERYAVSCRDFPVSTANTDGLWNCEWMRDRSSNHRRCGCPGKEAK